MLLQFSESTDDLLVVTDENDKPVFAYDFPYSYTYIALSTPELEESTYHVYMGGEIEGVEKDGLYTEITSYTGGTQLHHGGAVTSEKGFGRKRPEGMEPPEGFDGQRPELPEGMEWSEDMKDRKRERLEPPRGMEKEMPPRVDRQMTSSSDTITEAFCLSKDNKTFTNVSSVVNDSEFADVAKDAWYYNAVTTAASRGILTDIAEKKLEANTKVDREELVQMLYNYLGGGAEGTLDKNFSDADKVTAENAFAWALDSNIISGNQESLCPTALVTKAEAATMLVNAGK